MSDTTTFISQTKLNTLLERVCLPIDYLTQPTRPGVSVWGEPIRMCQQIEKESFLVDSIIIEARKNNAFFSGANSPRLYHAVLCRVYILLYYRHRDDKEYQIIVYPRLKANMGVYGSNLFNNIKANIDRVIELEEIARKDEAAKKRENANPKFSLPKLSRAELDELFDEYNKEKLFREFVLFYDRVIRPDDAKLDQAELWYTAKDIVRKLWHANYPETYIERIMNQFDTDLRHVGMPAPQYIMMCVYIMMRTVRDNRFADAIIRIESYMQNDNTDFHYLRRYMSSVKQWYNDNRPFDDYDYVGTPPEQESATIALPDIERIRQQVTEEERAELEKLQKEIDNLHAALAEKEKLCQNKDNTIGELEMQIASQQSAKEDNGMYDMTVELLSHIFYKNEADVKEFLQKIRNMKDSEITDLVYDWVKEKRISSKSQGTDLWKILHAAKLYSASKSNWNTALRNHPTNKKQ